MRSGARSLLGPDRRWRDVLFRKRWYAAETVQGKRVYPATDVVGYSFVVHQVLRVMRWRYPTLESLAVAGNAIDPAARPSLQHFVEAILEIPAAHRHH